MKTALLTFLSGFFLSALLQCSSDSSGNAYETPKAYFSTMTNLVVEVAYETGAEPYTGNVLATDLWSFTKNNLGYLFQTRSVVPTITVPTQISQMKSLGALNKNTWTTAELTDLGKAQRTGTANATTGDFFVVFLNGYLDNNGSPNTSVIGVSITGTSVVAIFKPVVVSAGAGSSNFVKKFVEQSTVVHELGHALGLVNNGVPLVSQHQDTANGAHCTNTHCVMYWQNEGGAAAVSFVQTYLSTGSENVFGTECTDDTRQYRP